MPLILTILDMQLMFKYQRSDGESLKELTCPLKIKAFSWRLIYLAFIIFQFLGDLIYLRQPWRELLSDLTSILSFLNLTVCVYYVLVMSQSKDLAFVII